MKKLWNAFFEKQKNTKVTDENILRLIMPSIIGILLCMTCLAGTSLAWFSSSIQTKPQTITAANYDMEVSIVGVDGAPVLPAADRNYSLIGNVMYTVTLKAKGTAETGGYCAVKTTSEEHYTSHMKLGDSLTFFLIPPADAIYTFTAVWGSYSGISDITNGTVLRENHPADAAGNSLDPPALPEGEPDQPPVSSDLSEPQGADDPKDSPESKVQSSTAPEPQAPSEPAGSEVNSSVSSDTNATESTSSAPKDAVTSSDH